MAKIITDKSRLIVKKVFQIYQKGKIYIRDHIGDWVGKIMIYAGISIGMMLIFIGYMEKNNIKEIKLSSEDKFILQITLLSIIVILEGLLLLYRNKLDTKSKKSRIVISQFILFLLAVYGIATLFKLNNQDSTFVSLSSAFYLSWYIVFEVKTAFVLVYKKLMTTFENPQDRLTAVIAIVGAIITAATILN
ncbi:hypothetical protein [Listeria seeligeri]|uniref:hypothetical protein n=1 Tax=Listeria seeligeri TaxID=1640 RepID=UPI0016268B16|nr:hypothetical protein [Listeria seeligeri]MBC1746902.1 hypothetical protein [Listeria seeligeri]MBC2233041.1 hypothetical protein [Listeria seeligeri]MBF2626129.1 hypothetical protein [Listeria seeligeri]MBF2673477.1 hypothetical protein [Listeria seeligeri]